MLRLFRGQYTILYLCDIRLLPEEIACYSPPKCPVSISRQDITIKKKTKEKPGKPTRIWLTTMICAAFVVDIILYIYI